MLVNIIQESLVPVNLTVEQVVMNEKACEHLKKGKRYQFTPAVSATGFAGSNEAVRAKIKPADLTFSQGIYIGYIEGNHVFHGYPINDTRGIGNVKHRICFYRVAFIGGSKFKEVQ